MTIIHAEQRFARAQYLVRLKRSLIASIEKVEREQRPIEAWHNITPSYPSCGFDGDDSA